MLTCVPDTVCIFRCMKGLSDVLYFCLLWRYHPSYTLHHFAVQRAKVALLTVAFFLPFLCGKMLKQGLEFVCLWNRLLTWWFLRVGRVGIHCFVSGVVNVRCSNKKCVMIWPFWHLGIFKNYNIWVSLSLCYLSFSECKVPRDHAITFPCLPQQILIWILGTVVGECEGGFLLRYLW